jgi:hypothetical protein
VWQSSFPITSEHHRDRTRKCKRSSLGKHHSIHRDIIC